MTIVVPLQATHAYVPLVHRAEVDADGVVRREWTDPEREPTEEDIVGGRPWICRDAWECFVGLRAETIHWAVRRPPEWRPGLRWWICVPMHGVPEMTPGGHWPAYPTRVGAERAARRHLRTVIGAREPCAWRREGTLGERWTAASDDDHSLLDVTWSAIRRDSATWRTAGDFVVANVSCWRAEVVVPTVIRGRLAEDGVLVESTVEEGEPPPLNDLAVPWVSCGLERLRVEVRECSCPGPGP